MKIFFRGRRLLLVMAIVTIVGGLFYRGYANRLAIMLAMDRERGAPHEFMESTNGMIAATTGDVAVQAGLQILKEGGNAADAAVTTALAQVVHAGGSYVSFGGVMIVLYYDAATGRVYSLNAYYNTPSEENDPLSIPKTGGRTALVPGFMAGVQAVHDRFGKVAFKRLFEPAIDLAEQGEVINAMLASQIERKKSVLSRFPETKQIFTAENGRFYGMGFFRGGDLFRQPELAKTLRKVAAQGAAYMYDGAWGRKFVETIQKNGGKITLADMKNYKVAWEQPLQSTYRDFQIYAAGLSTRGGVDLIEALNLIELADLKKRGHWTNSAESLFWFTQIASCGNLLFTSPTINERLLSPESRATKETSRWIWEQMQTGKWPPASVVTNDNGDKKHSAAIVAVDRWGNIAIINHSINADTWGNTGLFVDGVSIPDSAAFQQQQIKVVGPGQRLPTAPSPLFVFHDGKPLIGCNCIGGGGKETMLQVLVNMLDFGMKPQVAVDVPAFLPSAGWDHTNMVAQFEKETFDFKVLEGLQAMGMKVKISSDAMRRGYWVGIQIDPQSQHLQGAVSRGLNPNW
jgi:gamma-glutamyltranspeptidase / glutathione hydrolase